MGHWKAECPQRRDQAREQANVVQQDGLHEEDLPQVKVIVEEIDEARCRTCRVGECFHVQDLSKHPIKHRVGIPESIRARAIQFLSRHLSTHWSKGKPKGIGKMNKWDKRGKTGYNARSAKRNTVRMPCAETMMPASTNNATCLASQSQIGTNGRQETGLAIIDTGASRSVIGTDHVPAVLQKLPETVRNMVREQPSRVGFRLGNNQIAYGFKQIQIPLNYGKRQILLLIEVVPNATPSLLSIKTMKSLGGTLDLDNSTCFLKTLNKSLPLRENYNGAFMISMSDTTGII